MKTKNIPLEMQTQDRHHGMWTRIEILMNNKISVFPTGQLMRALKKMGFLANSLNNLVIIEWGAVKQLLRKFLWLIFHSKEKWDHKKAKYISTGKWLYLPFFPFSLELRCLFMQGKKAKPFTEFPCLLFLI